MTSSTLLFMQQIQGHGCVYAFTATLITYKSYTVASKNSELFQQKAMWKVVLAMLYGAHLQMEDFCITLNNYIVHFNQDGVFGWPGFLSPFPPPLQLIILNSSLQSPLS